MTPAEGTTPEAEEKVEGTMTAEGETPVATEGEEKKEEGEAAM